MKINRQILGEYQGRIRDRRGRPGLDEHYLVPSELLSPIRQNRRFWRQMIRTAVQTGSWRRASGQELIDFNSSDEPIIINMAQEIDIGAAFYLHGMPRDLLTQCLSMGAQTHESYKLYTSLMSEGLSSLWFAVALSEGPFAFPLNCPMDRTWQHSAVSEILDRYLAWTDHLIWLNDRIVAPFFRNGWPSWSFGLLNAACSLGMSDELAQNIMQSAPEDAVCQLRRWRCGDGE